LLQLDIKATPDENGIDDEATLTVQLAGISFPEVVQDLLLLNPDMTEEMATAEGANLDADGKLISWHLSDCPITALTEWIGGLTSLTYLDVSGTAIKELPESISGCLALKELHCYGCRELTSLGGLWQLDIKELSLQDCRELNMDSTLEMIALNFKNIETLNIAETNVTVLAEGIGGCTALQTFDLRACTKLTSLGDGIGGCTALRDLNLRFCSSLTSLGDGIGGLTSLTYLQVGNTAIKELPESVKQLESQGCRIHR